MKMKDEDMMNANILIPFYNFPVDVKEFQPSAPTDYVLLQNILHKITNVKNPETVKIKGRSTSV